MTVGSVDEGCRAVSDGDDGVRWRAGHARRPSATPPAPNRTQWLCRAAVAELSVDGAAVAMVTPSGERDLVHATDAVIAHLDELQFSLAEGPCLDAVRTGFPVLVSDLRAGGAPARWPVFARDAEQAGAAAVFAYPLSLQAVTFGVLELYRRTPGPLRAGEDEAVASVQQAMARVALDELLGPPETAEDPHSWPARLTAAHARVHQAAGVVAVHHDLPVADALARLRAAAYTRGIPLTELADGVLAGRTELDKDPS